jgi:hypothetical protein
MTAKKLEMIIRDSVEWLERTGDEPKLATIGNHVYVCIPQYTFIRVNGRVERKLMAE